MFIALLVLVFRSSVAGMPPLFFITFRKDVAAWSWISHVALVEAQMIHSELFYHLVQKSLFDPQTISFLRLRSWKQIYVYVFWAFIQKRKPFHSEALVFLYKFETSALNVNVAWWTEQSFFCHTRRLQPSLFINLLQTWLANRWGYLAKFFFCT